MLAGLATLTAACASDPAKRQQVAREESARMRVPEVPLGAYGAFDLMPIAMSADVAAKPEKVEVAKQLGVKLDARLAPLLKGWTSAAPADQQRRILVISPTVASLRVISSGARFWGGAWAGDSSIELDLTLVEKDSGRMIANQRISKTANAMAGAWSVGATDQTLLDYVVEIAYEYLASNHRQ